MEFNKKLIESKQTDKEVLDLIKDPNFITHPFVKKWMEGYGKAVKEGTITLKESEPEIGALRGQTVGDAVSAGAGMQVYATLEIFNAVIRGFTRYMDDTFVRKYTTDSVIFKVPKVEYRELAENISSGQLAHTEKMIDYATVNLSTPESEKGGKVTWTRALLEDITFDVQAEMAEGLGHAIAYKMLKDILTTVITVSNSTMLHKQPLGGNASITSGGWTWAEFLKLVGAVDTGYQMISCGVDGNRAMDQTDIGGLVTITTGEETIYGICMDYTYDSSHNYLIYAALQGNYTPTSAGVDNGDVFTVTNSGADVYTGTVNEAKGAITSLGFRTWGPADFCLVSPDIYWELLNIIQMTNVLYEGSTDPIKKGVIKLALGVTISKQGLLPKRTAIALNSEKAVALVTRRTLKIEPVLFPAWNEYGFIGTVRYGTTLIFNQAIQYAKT